MVRKKNSFVITDIKDYQKKMDDKEGKIDEKKGKKSFEKKSNSNELKNNSKKFSKFTAKQEIKRNDVKCDTNRTQNRDISGVKPFKTNRFRDQCFERRRESGLLLLPTNTENKIYNLKKSLKKKGLEESEIRDIIRKRRREEENKYNRLMSKSCFKCRQSGHILADCPFNSRDGEEGVDICYRCGSSEHKLSECRQKSEGLPFAKCFLCSQTGHLTRDCAQNKRGVYPKGGECKACHSVNHLIKDCPQNQKEQELEKEITLSTFEGIHSIDAEILDPITVKTENRAKKVIKF